MRIVHSHLSFLNSTTPITLRDRSPDRTKSAKYFPPFVVFMIGMGIDRWLAVSKWLPTASAMGPMLKTLDRNPEQGFLGAAQFFYPGEIGLVQYWKSILLKAVLVRPC